MPNSFRRFLCLVALFALLTIALTLPQILHPAGVLPHGDSWFNLWRLAWIAHQLPRDPLHLFDANIHYPARGTLAYSDAVLLQGLLGAPFHWLGFPRPLSALSSSWEASYSRASRPAHWSDISLAVSN